MLNQIKSFFEKLSGADEKDAYFLMALAVKYLSKPELLKEMEAKADSNDPNAFDLPEGMALDFCFEKHILKTRICPFCGAKAIIKFGKKDHKQRFRCKDCKKIVTRSTGTIMSNSHQSEETWELVIKDTLDNVSIAKTAEKTDLSEHTIFNMRHKILMGMEQLGDLYPVVFSNVTEIDDTFVQESRKGTKCVDRKPRKRGAPASKPGLSEEQVCICTGVERNQGPVMFKTVNRATPNKEEVKEVFEGHIADDAIVLTDGCKSYFVLSETMNVVLINAKKDNDSSSHLNNVNSSHSYFQSVYRHYRGVATKYINRYNAMLSLTYRSPKELFGYIVANLCSICNNVGTFSNLDVRKRRLVEI